MIAYFDIFSGISGDMTLAAFVDLGVPVEWLKKKLYSIPLKDFDIKSKYIWKNGIKSVNLSVIEKEHTHPRNYTQIKELILQSNLSDKVKSLSLKAFKKIAVAESCIHGEDIEKVHFHEVGGIDAIVDIVGSFLCVEYLKITDFYASIIPLGTGFVNCSHGTIPVPVPATLEILKGTCVKSSDIEMEIVTPTGACIITTLTSKFGSMPDMVIENTGYGAGKRETNSNIPNILRVITGQKTSDINKNFKKRNSLCSSNKY